MTSAFPEPGTGLLAEDLRDAWPFLDGQERIEGFRLLEASEAEDLFESLDSRDQSELLLRMRAHPLREVRDCAQMMLVELCKVIPAFLRRLVRPERGGAWSGYLARAREETVAVSRRLLDGIEPAPRGEVTLTDFDPDGEVKVVAAALYGCVLLFRP